MTIHLAYLTKLKEDEESLFDDDDSGDDITRKSFTTKTSKTVTTSRDDNMRTGGPLAAAWAVCFFIYMAYALLPIRLRYACIAGVIFSAAHLIGALLLYSQDYPAMLAHVSSRFD